MINTRQAARTLLDCWQSGQAIDGLESFCRPDTPEQGYAIQAAIAELRDESTIGWKIAATAEAGRAHINVDRPLAGRLYQSIVAQDGAVLSLGANRMGVAEAEIVLKLGQDLPPKTVPYLQEEVAQAVASVHPGLEIPDSRFTDFTTVGAACLIADNACADQFVLGPAAPTSLSPQSLIDQETSLWVNNRQVTSGHGRDALGGPLAALTWIANTLSSLGIGLTTGHFVTTGVTGQPCAVKARDQVHVDLGPYGSVSATLTA